MAKLPTYEEMAKSVAEKALDEYLYQGKSIREWVKIITEQELCEDCISRKEVNTLVDELARAISDERCCMSRGRSTATIMQDILDLPSVTPQPKMGKWIDDKCSICGKGIEDLISSREWYSNEELNFCPFCGVKIKEAEDDRKR